MIPELLGGRDIPQLFDTAPRGFRDKIRQSPVYDVFSRSETLSAVEVSAFEAEKSARWEAVTGLSPQDKDSKFTLIVPIHNEQAMLRDSLAAIMASDIPRDVQMNVVFVTNACTDGSVGIVTSFMENAGEVQETPFDQEASGDESRWRSFNDKGLNKTYHVVQPEGSNFTFTHIDTSTAGRANAINRANKFAVEAGHRISMATDSDSFLEQDAIPELFADSYQEIVVKTNGAALLGGNWIRAMQKQTLYSKVKQRLRGTGIVEGAQIDEKQLPKGSVQGCLMAWDTQFVEDLGGIPQVVLEDYALVLEARKADRPPVRVKEARVWSYTPVTMRDKLRAKSRSIQGLYQIADQGEYQRETIRQERSTLLPLRERLAAYRGYIRPEDRKSIIYPVVLTKSVLESEFVRYLGKRAYKKNPKSETWERTASTRPGS
jgi:cellulose synthase/poly-beta-1,6-N-acetylglucosamine synthase-like glycosyltransferase